MKPTNKPIIFFDFDDTIFDYNKYQKWLVKFFKSKMGIDFDIGKDEKNKHYKILDNGLLMYDFESHLGAHTKHKWSVVSQKILEAFSEESEPDFCFADATDAIKQLRQLNLDIRILTFGSSIWQKFKISHCVAIKDLPVSIVQESKASFLERELSTSSGFLIDDKYPLNLPTNWKHIWINRELNISGSNLLPDGTSQISTLKTVPKLILDQ